MKVPCEHLLILFLLSHAFVCCVMGQEEYNHKKSTVAPRDKVQREIHVTRDQQTSQNNGGCTAKEARYLHTTAPSLH